MRNVITIGIALVATLCTPSTTTAQQAERWRVLGELDRPHIYGVIAKVGMNHAYYVGGYGGDVFSDAVSHVDRFEVSGTNVSISRMPSLPEGLAEMPVIVLDDTALVVVGGFNDRGRTSSAVYMYSIARQVWQKVGDMITSRRQHAAYRYSKDEILVAGGRHSNLETMDDAEIFNLTTGQSRSISPFPVPINGAVYGLMSNGKGVVLGGRDGGPNSNRVSGIYTYNGATNAWTKTSDMSSGREAPFGMRLEDGRMVVVGGSTQEQPSALFIGECLVERNGVFERSADIPYGVVYAGITERMPRRVLTVGGWLSDLTSTDQCTYWDVETGAITPGPKLNISRRYTRSVTLGGSGLENRTTFAISGVSNRGVTQTIEILQVACDSMGMLFPLESMKLVGNAIYAAPNIMLTQSATYQRGAAWLPKKVNVSRGLDVRFMFRLANGNDNGQVDKGPEGADGVVFVLQNAYPTVIGKVGDGIGYNEIPSGLAVEFDAFLNAAFSDPSGSHIAIQAGDGQYLRAWHVPPYLKAIATKGVPQFVADGRVFHARIVLEGKTMSVYCDTTGELNTPVVVATDIDLQKILSLGPDGAAYAGFTAATGFAQQSHEILGLQIGGCETLVSVDDDAQPIGDSFTARVVPMPASSSAVIEVSVVSTRDRECRIMDARGVCVMRMVLPAGRATLELPVDRIAQGAYTVLLQDGMQRVSVPLVVTR